MVALDAVFVLNCWIFGMHQPGFQPRTSRSASKGVLDFAFADLARLPSGLPGACLFTVELGWHAWPVWYLSCRSLVMCILQQRSFPTLAHINPTKRFECSSTSLVSSTRWSRRRRESSPNRRKLSSSRCQHQNLRKGQTPPTG